MTEERADSVVREVGGVIIKQHRGDAASRAKHEFETLTMLRAAMPEEYTVPRAIQLDETNGSLVMERAAGVPLDGMIREYKRVRDALERLTKPMRRAGEWLRAMQSTTEAGRGPTSSAREILAAQVAKAIRDAETAGLDPEIVARVRELQIRVAPRALVACGHHGDYWPGNIFLDPERVTVIDFEGYRRGLPLEDVAYFLIQLELLMPRHARLLPALRVAFLEGYGGIDDADALQLFTLTKTLHLISRDAGAQHSFLLALWMRLTLRNIVKRCLPR